MQSKSEKQKKPRRAAAHNKDFSKKAETKQGTAKEFHNKDRVKYGHKGSKKK